MHQVVENVSNGLNTTDKRYLKWKMELIGKLGSKAITNNGMLPSASKNVSINLKITVYTFSIAKKYWMDSKLSQSFKKESNDSNINNLYTMFKGTIMLITEVWNWDATTKFFHNWLLLRAKYCHMAAREF